MSKKKKITSKASDRKKRTQRQIDRQERQATFDALTDDHAQSLAKKARELQRIIDQPKPSRSWIVRKIFGL